MCNFFTCIVTRAQTVLYTEEDTHETVIKRSGLTDDLKNFVRIEYSPIGGYIIDEHSIPEWYERMDAKAKSIAMAAYNRVITAHNVMRTVQRKEFKWTRQLMFETSSWGPDSEKNWHKYLVKKRAAQNIYKACIYNLEGYLAPTSERL